jgi:hypothetical protein
VPTASRISRYRSVENVRLLVLVTAHSNVVEQTELIFGKMKTGAR